MSEPTQIDNIEVLDPAKPIVAYNPIRAAIAELTRLHGGVQFDVTTTAGMDAAKKARAEIREPRYKIEHIRKALKAPALQYSKRIDEEAKEYTEALMALETPIDEQIKAEEKRKQQEKEERERQEQARRDQIATALSEIQFLPVYAKDKDVMQVELLIAELEAQEITEEAFGVRIGEAGLAKQAALKALRDIHAQKVEAARQAEEEERQRAEREQQQREEAARLAAEREAVEKEKAELAKMRAELEAQQAAAEPQPESAQQPVADPEQAAEDPGVVAVDDSEPFLTDSDTPFIDEAPAALVSVGFDTADPAADHTIVAYNHLPDVDSADLEADAPPPAADIIELVADHYDVDQAMAHKWLVAMFGGGHE